MHYYVSNSHQINVQFLMFYELFFIDHREILQFTDTQCKIVKVNEGGFLKEKCQAVIDKQFYKCPFEDEYFEIERKFLCNTDPRFINDTTGELQLKV